MLVALAVQLGGFVNRALAVLILRAAFVLLVVTYVTREHVLPADLFQPSPSEIAQKQRERALRELRELLGTTREIVAPDDSAFDAAKSAYAQGALRSHKVISDHFGDGEAEAFAELGPLPRVATTGVWDRLGLSTTVAVVLVAIAYVYPCLR